MQQSYNVFGWDMMPLKMPIGAQHVDPVRKKYHNGNII
jgi:hypothetical protein